MSLILDLLVIAVAVIVMIIGARRGFVKSLLSLLSTLLAFLAAWFFSPSVSVWLSQRFFSAPITGWVESSITSLLTKNGDGYDLTKLFSDRPDAFTSLLSGFGANEGELASDYAGLSSAGADKITAISEKIASPVVSLVSNVVAFLGVFLVALAVLAIASALIGLVTRLPVLHSLDTLLGFLFGAAAAAVLVLLLCKLLPQLVSALAPFNPVLFGGDVIENTTIVSLVSRLDLSFIWERVFPAFLS